MRPRRTARSVTSGIGTASGPPGVVQPSTSLSTRSGAVDGELLRDHPAEARPEHVRALDARLVEHLQRVAGHLRGRVRPCRLVGLADAAVVEGDRRRWRAARARDDRIPAPARRSRAPGSAAAAGPPRSTPTRSSRGLLLHRRLAQDPVEPDADLADPREPAGDEEDDQDEEHAEDEERLLQSGVRKIGGQRPRRR